MLYVTGTFNGKTVKAEPVSAAEIAERFQLPKMPLAGQPDLVLRVPKSRQKTDGFGQKSTPRGVGLPAFYMARSGSDSFEIRYATSETPTDSGRPRYLPHKVFLNGASTSFPAANYEAFVFLALHPRCLTSPLHDGGEALYEVYDPEKVSALELQIHNRDSEITRQILDMGEADLRLKCKGLNVQGNRITNAHSASVSELRAALIDLQRKNADAFADSWHNQENQIDALLRHAIDIGIIITIQQGGGNRPGYRFRSDIRGGEIISTHTAQEDAFTALRSAALQKYDSVFPEIQRYMDASASDGELTARTIDLLAKGGVEGDSPNQFTPEQIVKAGYASGIIALDFAKKTVHRVKDGEMDETPLFAANSGRLWQEELAEHLKTNSALRQSLVMSLRHALNKK